MLFLRSVKLNKGDWILNFSNPEILVPLILDCKLITESCICLAHCLNWFSVLRLGNSAKEHSELSIVNKINFPEGMEQNLSTGCLKEDVKNQTGLLAF